MKIKTAALLTALSVMLTGCGSVYEEPMGVTAPETEEAFGTALETTETSVRTQAPETEPPSETDDQVTVFYQRPNPEKEVSVEEFEEYIKKLSYSFSVPEGAEEVTYIIDTGYPAAKMFFYLNGAEWTADVRMVDKNNYAPHPYVADYMTEIDCEFESGQVTKVHGVEGDIGYYEISFSEGIVDRYKLWAEWYLQEDGLAVGLTGWSDDPIHTMPVEALD